MEKLRLRHQIVIRSPKVVERGKGVTVIVPFKEPFKDIKTIINNQGQILNTAITLENDLKQFLEILLHSNLYNSSDFDKRKWRKRNGNFHYKIQILKKLSSSHKYIKRDQDEWKKFHQVLSGVREIRNHFAHGEIYFKEGKAYLSSGKAKKEKTVELDKTYWKKVKEIFEHANTLSSILRYKLSEYSNATSHNNG